MSYISKNKAPKDAIFSAPNDCIRSSRSKPAPVARKSDGSAIPTAPVRATAGAPGVYKPLARPPHSEQSASPAALADAIGHLSALLQSAIPALTTVPLPQAEAQAQLLAAQTQVARTTARLARVLEYVRESTVEAERVARPLGPATVDLCKSVALLHEIQAGLLDVQVEQEERLIEVAPHPHPSSTFTFP
ncbi:hypothetical protein C8R45DRAFT_1153368 [Mycena sanguinolenta]|nr:hypothetical protein C8R45DRAFT_1153368 [Mycena sanguinolenta]